MFVKTRIYPKIGQRYNQKGGNAAFRYPFWVWLKGMDHEWSNTERRKENLVKGIYSNNPYKQQIGVHRKNPNNSLEIQKSPCKTEIRKKTLVKKSNKVNVSLQSQS